MAQPTEARIRCAPGRKIALDGDDAPQVNVERPGNMGSSLAMSTNGQLFLAPGNANLEDCQYKFKLEWCDCKVKLTSSAYPNRVITAHTNNLTVDGNQSTSNSIIWWQLEDLPGNDCTRKHMYITDENGQSLYFYVKCNSGNGEQERYQFKLGNEHDKIVAADDIFQIITDPDRSD